MTRTTLCAPLFALALATLAAAQPQPDGPIPDPPAAPGAEAYRLTPAREGLLLSWHEPIERGVRLCWSRLTSAGWTAPRQVMEENGGVVVNWADVPAVVEGGDGAMYAHWLRPSGGGGATYDIIAHRSTDGGEIWRELGKLNDDNVEAEHGFVSYVPLDRGVRAYWLDGRETAGAHGDAAHGHGGHHAGTMTLRTTLVGETIRPSQLVDDSVCDCCNTAAAITAFGPVVAYRDRSEGEIRDISIAREAPASIRPVHEDGWLIPGCPVNGPAIAAEGERVVVAWYTGSPEASVKAAFSTDGGETFADAITLDRATGASVPLGRVDVVTDGAGAIVCWLRAQGREGSLLAQRVGASGPRGEPVMVAPMAASRRSGFPQMERLGDRLIIVWRDVETERLRVSEFDAASVGR